MIIKEMRPEDRPLQRLIKKGPQALSDTELLAIIIWKINNDFVLNKVYEIFKKYNLKTLSQVSVSELKKLLGDEVKACQIIACFELARRLASYTEEERPMIEGPEDIFRILGPELQTLKKECVKVVLLDSRNRVIKTETISLGTLDTNIVHPRELFRTAISETAASVILVHNHPSGNSNPSDGDIELTKRIVEASQIIGIEVKDHIIVGENKFTSLKDIGIIS